MKTDAVVDEFVSNRAEQLDADVTNEFIVPYFFESLTLHRDRKSVRVIGGRGCGKTLFLRYFSHRTQLSSVRESIPTSVFAHGIGLYWKTDTGFCDLMKPEWLGERNAHLAFLHYTAAVVLEEFCCFVDALARAPLEGGPIDLRARALPRSVPILLGEEVADYGELKTFAKERRYELSSWLQNPTGTPPHFLRIDDLLAELADDVSLADPRLERVFFRIFVDEFENLKASQQRLIGDLVKHPRPRFSFNLAMRRNSVENLATSGNERIAEPHDIRTIDLEAQTADRFKELAAELLLMKFSKCGVDINCPEFEMSRLHDPARLSERMDKDYLVAVRAAANRLLPARDAADIARGVFEDGPLENRWRDVVARGLKKHGVTDLTPADFVRVEEATASVVAAFVLNRDKAQPHVIHQQLLAYGRGVGRKNPFHDWVGTNTHGALMYLYEGLPRRPNPLYAGFGRYCGMAMPNMRFFIEFCHTALRDYSFGGSSDRTGAPESLPESIQALAAKDTSSLLLNDVHTLGLRGRELQTLVKRLGRLFQAAHRRHSQSEAEVNHFSIDEGDREALTEETRALLRESIIWSVLYQQKDTKNKSDASLVQDDYVPNPIFSAHFGISYRKRRKLTLPASEVNLIFTGTDSHFEQLLVRYVRQWDSEALPAEQTAGLFE